jgi:hypothetical protein
MRTNCLRNWCRVYLFHPYRARWPCHASRFVSAGSRPVLAFGPVRRVRRAHAPQHRSTATASAGSGKQALRPKSGHAQLATQTTARRSQLATTWGLPLSTVVLLALLALSLTAVAGYRTAPARCRPLGSAAVASIPRATPKQSLADADQDCPRPYKEASPRLPPRSVAQSFSHQPSALCCIECLLLPHQRMPIWVREHLYLLFPIT